MNLDTLTVIEGIAPLSSVITSVTELRQRRGWSKTELAKIVGCSREMIGQIECRRKKPSPPLCDKMARALRVPYKFLAEELGVTAIKGAR